METLMVLVAVAAFIAVLFYLAKRQWRPAGIAGAAFILAIIIHANLNHGAAQQLNNGFPIPLNSGAGAAGQIPK